MAKVEREKFSNSANKDILATFRDLAEQTGINQNRLLDEALSDLIEKYKKQKRYTPLK